MKFAAVCCSLVEMCCLPSVVCWLVLLRVVCRVLCVVCCMRVAARCASFVLVVGRLLRIVCCSLFVVCCLLLTVLLYAVA